MTAARRVMPLLIFNLYSPDMSRGRLAILPQISRRSLYQTAKAALCSMPPRLSESLSCLALRKYGRPDSFLSHRRPRAGAAQSIKAKHQAEPAAPVQGAAGSFLFAEKSCLPVGPNPDNRRAAAGRGEWPGRRLPAGRRGRVCYGSPLKQAWWNA